MNCQEIERQIVLFTELTTDEQANVIAHLQTCTACEKLFESVTQSNQLMNRLSKVTMESEDPFKLTNSIMERIKTESNNRWNFLKISIPIFEFNYVKYGMTAGSFALVALFGAEQMTGVPKARNTATLSSLHQVNASAANTRLYQNEIIKSKVTAKFLLNHNCVSPFNINKVNIACLRQKALHKEI